MLDATGLPATYYDALLDQFAGQALMGLLAQTDHTTESGYPCPVWNGDADDRDFLAQRAYSIASAMVRQRKTIAADKTD